MFLLYFKRLQWLDNAFYDKSSRLYSVVVTKRGNKNEEGKGREKREREKYRAKNGETISSE